MNKNKKGFSLIELLIVITIIGILAVVMLPKITTGPARARDAQRITDVASIANAVEMYKQDNNGAFPACATGPCSVTTLSMLSSYFDKGAAPTDPTASQSYNYYKTTNGFIVFADTEVDKFNTSGYCTRASLSATTGTSCTATTSETGNANVYAYVK